MPKGSHLRETLQELPRAGPENRGTVRVCSSPAARSTTQFTKMCEWPADSSWPNRYCFGSMPGREEIPLEGGQDVLQSIADCICGATSCPRAMGPETSSRKRSHFSICVEKYHADGIIVGKHEVLRILGLRACAGDGMVLRGLSCRAATGVPDREGLHGAASVQLRAVPGVHRGRWRSKRSRRSNKGRGSAMCETQTHAQRRKEEIRHARRPLPAG